MVGVILAESEVTDLYRGKVKTIRTQRCRGCNRALAMEVSSNIGFDGEYWIIDSAIGPKGRSEHYFKRSGRWFGNHVQCPTCLREGKLPMDKPLNWDKMEETREGANAVQS
jgi:hypothetical protein